jgi:hypothetical protein
VQHSTHGDEPGDHGFTARAPTPPMTNAPRDEFIATLAQALGDGTFVKLTLGKGMRDELRQAFVRLVQIRHEPHITISFRHAHKDITANHPVAAAPGVIRQLLDDSFGNAHLFTTQADTELMSNKKSETRLVRHKPTSRCRWITIAPNATCWIPPWRRTCASWAWSSARARSRATRPTSTGSCRIF